MHSVAGDSPYTAEAIIGKDTYMFYLNVCGETRAGECKDEKGFVSSCQVKVGQTGNKVAGRYQKQTLRWARSDFYHLPYLYLIISL